MAKKDIKKKISKYIGIILLLVSMIYLYKFGKAKYKDKQETSRIIENQFLNTNSYMIINEKENKLELETNKLNNYYLGYIEIPSLNIKRLIVKGTGKEILDKNLIGILKSSVNLDSEFGNIILAGHNTNNVFQNLHKAKIGDKIKIVTLKDTYTYAVKDKQTIDESDMSFFKQVSNKKILTLVTCENNIKKRLIVVAELDYQY